MEMPFGRSEPLGPFSLSRPVVQRMRALSRAHDVVSTIVCWCRSRPGWWQFRREKAWIFAEQALHQRMNHTPIRYSPSRAVVLPSLSEFSPRSYKLGAGKYWRKVIVAGRAGNQVLLLTRLCLGRELAPSPIRTERSRTTLHSARAIGIGQSTFCATARRRQAISAPTCVTLMVWGRYEQGHADAATPSGL